MALARISPPRKVFKSHGGGKRGQLSIPVVLDFVTSQSWTIDLTSSELQDAFDRIETIYVDNSANLQQLFIICGATGQVLVVPPNSCAYLPMLQPNPSQFDVTSTGALVVTIQLLNFSMEPFVWRAIAGGSSGSAAVSMVTGSRLTPSTGVPIITSDITAATTVFFTAWIGNQTLIYDGTNFIPTSHGELSQTLADATKSPAAAAASSAYDMFVWSDGGIIRCTRGPVWTSTTVRGAGAGTTELIQVNGIFVNRFAITNGPAANKGTYVGSILTNASTQLDMQFNPAGAAGGSNPNLNFWNMYNRRRAMVNNFDNTNSWTYTLATYRTKNGNVNNRITFFIGMADTFIRAKNTMGAANSTANTTRSVAIGLNSASVVASNCHIPFTPATSLASQLMPIYAEWYGVPTLGANFLAPLEQSTAVGTCTWFGDNAGGSPPGIGGACQNVFSAELEY
jgi:hypothetical protein